MSTKRSVGRFTATNKMDRSGLCAFTFADGRQCRTPRRSGHPHLCYFHAQKEAEALAAKQAGEDISSFFSKHYVSGCNLSAALARVFRAVARGEIKPKTAATLAYVGQTLIQALPIAEHEYSESFSDNSWRSAVRASVVPPAVTQRPTTPPSRISPSPQPALLAQPATPAEPVSASQPSPAPPPKSANSDQSS
jgi:hypothetical protein